MAMLKNPFIFYVFISKDVFHVKQNTNLKEGILSFERRSNFVKVHFFQEKKIKRKNQGYFL